MAERGNPSEKIAGTYKGYRGIMLNDENEEVYRGD
jgi:hypothetical protein